MSTQRESTRLNLPEDESNRSSFLVPRRVVRPSCKLFYNELCFPTNAHDFHRLCSSYFYNGRDVSTLTVFNVDSPRCAHISRLKTYEINSSTCLVNSLKMVVNVHNMYVLELQRVYVYTVECILCKNQQELYQVAGVMSIQCRRVFQNVLFLR